MITKFDNYIKEKSEFDIIHSNITIISNYLQYIVKKLNTKNEKLFDFRERLDDDKMEIYFDNYLAISIYFNIITGKFYISYTIFLEMEDITNDRIPIAYSYINLNSIKDFKENIEYLFDNYYRLIESTEEYKKLIDYSSLDDIPVFNRKKYNIFMFNLFKQNNFRNLKTTYNTLWLDDELREMFEPYINASNFDLL